MGTMASSNTCDPEKDYTYEECVKDDAPTI